MNKSAQKITEEIEIAGAIIRRGGVIAFPTETVYGLGANLFNTSAVTRIFAIKNRPLIDPLIAHIGKIDHIELLTYSLPDKATELVKKFWPGPLTIIVKRRSEIPDIVTSNLPGVGIRMPANKIARDIIIAAGIPVAAPSANPFGGISPTSAQHVRDELGDKVDLIINGGICSVGIESTIVSFMHDTPRLLRHGAISICDIEETIGPIDCTSTKSTNQPPCAPGNFERHYSPRTKMILEENATASIGKCGYLMFKNYPDVSNVAVVEILSETGDLVEAAQTLYAKLRKLDNANINVIIAQQVPDIGIGKAINDRLKRATHK